MKKSKFLIVIVLFNCLLSSIWAQNAPGVQWTRFDWPRIEPTTNLPQSREKSGEDWWYDHENVFINGQHTGYIAGGFSEGLNRDVNANTYKSLQDELYTCGDRVTPTCTDFEVIGRTTDCTKSLMFEYELNGNMKWCRIYYDGEFTDVQQTSDGGFIAGGYTRNSHVNGNPNAFSNGQLPNQTRLLYNPINSSSNQFLTKNPNVAWNTGSSRVGIVKTDSEGKIQWMHNYGPLEIIGGVSNSIELTTMKAKWVSIVEINSDFWVVAGYEYRTSIGGPVIFGSFLLKLDSQGYVKEKMLLAPQIITVGSAFISLKDVKKGPGSNTLYVAGSFHEENVIPKSYVAKIDITGTPNILWENLFSAQTVRPDPVNPSNTPVYRNSIIHDIEVRGNGNILVPAIVNCYSGDCFSSNNSTNKAELEIHEITSGGSRSVLYNLGEVNAYDLKAGITNTSDGGFAVVSSKGQYDSNGNLILPAPNDPLILSLLPPNTPNCHEDYKAWMSDVFVAKFSSSNSLEWQKTYDSHPNERQSYPYDLKKQECVYEITEDQATGDLVISGNTSHNFDDAYLLKLTGCQNDLNSEPITSVGAAGDEIIISNNTTWNSNKIIRGLVRVQNILIIDGATIQFADKGQSGQESGILIEPGAKLIVRNGATLTSIAGCESSTWSGIKVASNNFIFQSNNNSGQLELDGTINRVTIENADNAIFMGDPYNISANYWSSFGGIVHANGVDFKNNLRDAAFNSFGSTNTNIYYTQYDSYFKNCKFTKTEKYKAGLKSGGSVTIWACHGIDFENCVWDFTGEDYDEQSVQAAIYTVDASFNVTGNVINETASSRFINCNYGIYSFKSWDFPSRVVINNTLFDNNKKGAFLYGASGYRIQNNTFKIPSLPKDEYDLINAYGVYNRSKSSIQFFNNNTFEGIGTGGFNAGVIVSQSYSLPNVIEQNTFKDLYMANESNMDNRSNDQALGVSGLTGLEYHCNYFDNNDINIYVHHQPYPGNSWTTINSLSLPPTTGIKKFQGSNTGDKENLAGNQFDATVVNDIDVNLSRNNVIYVHHNETYLSNPQNLKPSISRLITSYGFDLEFNGSCPSIGSTVLNKTELDGIIEDRNALIASSKGFFDENVDFGNHINLLEAIGFYESIVLYGEEDFPDPVFNDDGDQFASLYNNILGNAPWMSDEAAAALIMQLGFSDVMLNNILLAHPHVLRNPKIMDLLELYRDGFLAYIDGINNARANNYTDYENKMMLLSNYSTDKFKAVEEMASLLFFEDIGNGLSDLDELISFYSAYDEPIYQYRKATLELVTGDYSSAQNTLTNLSVQNNFEGDDEKLFNDFSELLAIASNANGNVANYTPTASEEIFLARIAEERDHPLTGFAYSFSLTKKMATATLHDEIPNDRYDPVYDYNVTYNNKKNIVEEKALVNQQLISSFYVYPNPSSSYFNVVSTDILEGEAVLYDVRGAKLRTVVCKNGLAILPLTSLPSGIYVIKLSNRIQVQTQKVIID